MDLLSLPYDVRYKIYEHLFPPGQQIYIQVLGQTLQSITPEHKLPTGLFATCKALNAEASEYLYNKYLFNIIGTKQHCLSAYKDFLDTVKKHARNEVHVDAFSNGTHSSTMCISIHSGEGKMAMLKRRERGEPKKIYELEKEVAASRQSLSATSGAGPLTLALRIAGAVFALLALFIAWWIA